VFGGSPASATHDENVCYLVGGAAYHLVKGVYRCEGGGVVKGRILVRRAAFTNAMRRNVRVIVALHLVYASSTIRAIHYTEVKQAPGGLRRGINDGEGRPNF
jgi:hypothetical protein